MVPGGGCRKGVIIQGIMTPTGVLPNGQSCLGRTVDVTVASVRAPIQRNSTYVQMFRQSIYKIIQPEHPQSPIRQYKQCPQGPPSQPCYMYCNTQAENITTNLKVGIYFTLPALSATNFVTLNFHVHYFAKGRYDMILGKDILTEVGLNLKLSENVIKADDGTFNGSTTPMVDLGTYILNI